jgi:hypothetical protein
LIGGISKGKKLGLATEQRKTRGVIVKSNNTKTASAKASQIRTKLRVTDHSEQSLIKIIPQFWEAQKLFALVQMSTPLKIAFEGNQ